MHDVLEATIPAYELVLGGGAPQYTREYSEPRYFEKINAFDINTIEDITDIKSIAEQIIQIPNIASKRWVYNQYDSMVGTANASTNAPSDASIVLAKATARFIGISSTSSPWVLILDKPLQQPSNLLASSKLALNLIFSFLELPGCVVAAPVSSFNVSNVKKSVNGDVLKFLLSLSGITFSMAKFVLHFSK